MLILTKHSQLLYMTKLTTKFNNNDILMITIPAGGG